MATFFSLPPEIRRQVYDYVFVDTHAVLDFNNTSVPQPTSPARRNSFTMSSHGNLGLLRASKQYYADAVDSYHDARTVHIKSLDPHSLEEFQALSHVHNTARKVELEDFQVNDLSIFPTFPKLKSLVLHGVKMWGGNMVVEKGQTALEAFNDGFVLMNLSRHVRYSSLSIEQRISKYFPTANIVINFWVGNQVLDKNKMKGVEDWSWACSYDVDADRLEKRLARRLTFW